MSVISTPITELFGIQHPILLAGMSVCASPMALVTRAVPNTSASVNAEFLTFHPQG